jgi:hypothetical protein
MLLGIIAALALGIAIGMWRPWSIPPANQTPLFKPFVPSPVDVTSLPRGGVVLVQRETNRLYILRTRPVGLPATEEPLLLSELRFQPGKGIKDTGNTYRLDVGRGRLTDPNGRAYPVTLDAASGVLEIQQAGTLRLNTKPSGLLVSIDGHAAGPTPVALPVQAGRHQVRVQTRSGTGILWDLPIEVPPGTTVSLSHDFGTGKGGAVARP